MPDTGSGQITGGGQIPSETLLVAQSGGPTVVINASLAGVISAASASGAFGNILGARHATEGLLSDSFVDLSDISQERLERLRHTPSAALGTSRHRPSDDDLQTILDTFQRRRITTFIPIGGNDTAEIALRLSSAATARGQDLRIVAVPKTIDNDLAEMDHCPGYGSIARFTALSVRDSAFDTRAMARLYPVKIVEVMGRNAGWLAASATLGFCEDLPRPIICLPERPVAGFAELKEWVTATIARDGYAVLVVPETMKWADGTPVGGTTPDWQDGFGHKYFRGVGTALSRQLSAELGVQARYDKPGTIARMAMYAASAVDLAEAEQAGAHAVERALAGEHAVMVAIQRSDTDQYRMTLESVPLELIANIERRLPDAMIASSGHDVTDAFQSWALPLLGAPLPKYEVLK